MTMITCLAAIAAFLVVVDGMANVIPWPVTIATSTVKHTTEERFLSYGMDSNLIRDRWETFDFHSTRLKTLASGLSPAYLRLMGTDGDHVIFQLNSTNQTSGKSRVRGFPPFPHTFFNMTTEDWDSINRFAAEVGWRIVFGINGQIRAKTPMGSQWDPINAVQLLEYSILKGYNTNLDFEFGNEPTVWGGHPEFFTVTGKKLAQEFNAFRYMLDNQFGEFFGDSKLYGPDIGLRWDFMVDFLNNVALNTVSGVTYHHYYGGGELGHVANMTNSTIMDTYIPLTQNVLNIVKNSPVPDTPVWQGESSALVGYPNSDIAESYVAGFMFLDKQGLSASMGLAVVIRQTFYGFWFALVDENLFPRPNYWTALLYHRLVGEKVLETSPAMSSNKTLRSEVRLYTHCTSSSSNYPPGSVVVYGMNLLSRDVKLQFNNQSELTVDAFILSPYKNNITSEYVQLNGEILLITNDQTLPALKPAKLAPGQPIILPSLQYGFFVIQGLNVPVCRNS